MKPETEAKKVVDAAALAEENEKLKAALQAKEDHVAELKGALEEKGVKVRKSPRLNTKEGLEREIRRYVKKTVRKDEKGKLLESGYRRGLSRKAKETCAQLLRRWEKLTGNKRKPQDGWDGTITLPGIDNPTVKGMYVGEPK
jgi:hypothetical protein